MGFCLTNLCPSICRLRNAVRENISASRLIGAQLSRDFGSSSDLVHTLPCPSPGDALRAVSDLPAKRAGEVKKSSPTNPFIAFTGALSGNTRVGQHALGNSPR